MRQRVRFAGFLLLGLALLATLAYVVLERAVSAWSEEDLARHSKAIVDARIPAFANFERRADARGLHDTLGAMVRSHGLIAVCYCGATLEACVNHAPRPPTTCRDAQRALQSAQRVGETTPSARHGIATGSTGVRAHWTAVTVAAGDARPTTVMVANDLSAVASRVRQTRNFVALAFLVLLLGATLFLVFVARLSWRSWLKDVRHAVLGDGSGSRYQPVPRDMRALAQALHDEVQSNQHVGTWSAARLKQTLRGSLSGERVIVLANREPYSHERTSDGAIRIVRPASGLVTALEPLLQTCSGAWVAYGGGTADRETVDRHDHVRVPPGEGSYVLRRVWLSDLEIKGFYEGFSNEGLWPLCHIAHTRPVFRRDDWDRYREVNRKFTDVVCAEVDVDDPIILVQDYHFALAPLMLRQRLPRATIITFWHIPWPNAERFGICPWRNKILHGLLGSSILGFHTQQHCNNFLDNIDAYIESRIDREQHAVVHRSRRTLVRPYPISIEWPVRWLRNLPSVEQCRAQVLAELGLRDGTMLIVGVDRIDYTKGLEERLGAFELMLERFPELIGRVVLVQLAAPSRMGVQSYRELNQRVEEETVRINQRFGSETYQPIILNRAQHEPNMVYAYYRAAHVCCVSSLHDGMNLVAKEFVAARDDEQGVLVLSRFTGAARELSEALIVNPYDLEETSSALATALVMTPEEQRVRMRAMRSIVEEFNVYRWAGRMLLDASQLRRRERLHGRLSRVSLMRPVYT